MQLRIRKWVEEHKFLLLFPSLKNSALVAYLDKVMSTYVLQCYQRILIPWLYGVDKPQFVKAKTNCVRSIHKNTP